MLDLLPATVSEDNVMKETVTKTAAALGVVFLGAFSAVRLSVGPLMEMWSYYAAPPV